MIQAVDRTLTFMEFLESYPEAGGRYELIEGMVVEMRGRSGAIRDRLYEGMTIMGGDGANRRAKSHPETVEGDRVSGGK